MFKNGRQSFRCKPLHFFVLTLPYLPREKLRCLLVFDRLVREIIAIKLGALKLIKIGASSIVFSVGDSRQRNAALLRDRFELVVGLFVIVHQALGKLLDLRIRRFICGKPSKIDFGKPSHCSDLAEERVLIVALIR